MQVGASAWSSLVPGMKLQLQSPFQQDPEPFGRPIHAIALVGAVILVSGRRVQGRRMPIAPATARRPPLTRWPRAGQLRARETAVCCSGLRAV